MFTCLFLLAPPAPIDLEAEKARIAVQVAIAIAKAKEVKPAPTPKVEPAAPAVAVPARPFTQDGTRTFARSRDAAGFNTGSGVIYQMAPTFTSVPGAMFNGRISGCTSYG